MEAAQRHSGSAKVRFAALALHIFTAQLQLPLWSAIRASVPGPMTCLDQHFVSFWTVQGLFIPPFLDHVPHTSLAHTLSPQSRPLHPRIRDETNALLVAQEWLRGEEEGQLTGTLRRHTRIAPRTCDEVRCDLVPYPCHASICSAKWEGVTLKL
ncbi:hypothetical protein CPAR01_16508 [Colletotrichum paranaense]|uniref:Uncharacterized protein n=1 Tax=Colletotrichum paranaense TaxID=1914294 RepID=A0ABQ9RVM5_9PEZI|nr:uncharacterized protein CPAR01_16508 [Colletotrichum paranaense]KAK1515985.1 hypothetical protein CPAR01_16508 [Colletotrichum paranaense]